MAETNELAKFTLPIKSKDENYGYPHLQYPAALSFCFCYSLFFPSDPPNKLKDRYKKCTCLKTLSNLTGIYPNPKGYQVRSAPSAFLIQNTKLLNNNINQLSIFFQISKPITLTVTSDALKPVINRMFS